MAKRKATRHRSAPTAISSDRKWEIQNAADTLMRAQEIQQNSALMRQAKTELRKRQTAIRKTIKES